MTAYEFANLLGARQSGRGWSAHCPGPHHKNGDRSPSLSISEGDDGRVLVKCFTGCTFEEIVASLDLKPSDLFSDSRSPRSIAEAMGWSAEMLGELGALTQEHKEDEETLRAAALLSAIEYARQRDDIAKVLRITKSVLDAEVRKRRPNPSANGQGKDIIFEEIEPWPEAVDGEMLLGELGDLFSAHIILPLGAPETLAKWTVWTYFKDEFDVAPLLAFLSATKRCGKTRALTILSKVVYRPLAASNVTPAALFRMIDKYHPTILIDEWDSFGKDNNEIRGVVNSGHTKATAFVIRCVGDDNEPCKFSTWGAKAIAAIGTLAETLLDRSIRISLRRATSGERFVKRLPPDAYFHELRSKIVRWVNDNLDAIRSVEVVLPSGLDNRAEDNWGPLLAVAQVAGGAWPTAARQAAQILSGVESEDAREIGVQLLHDIRRAFGEDDRLHTNILLPRLNAMSESPWATYSRGKDMNAMHLARLLRPFDIKSKGIRIGGTSRNGFERHQFADAWLRYPENNAESSTGGPQVSTVSTTQSYQGFAPDSKGQHVSECGHSKNGANPHEIRNVDTVDTSEGEVGPLRVEITENSPPVPPPECDDILAYADAVFGKSEILPNHPPFEEIVDNPGILATRHPLKVPRLDEFSAMMNAMAAATNNPPDEEFP